MPVTIALAVGHKSDERIGPSDPMSNLYPTSVGPPIREARPRMDGRWADHIDEAEPVDQPMAQIESVVRLDRDCLSANQSLGNLRKS